MNDDKIKGQTIEKDIDISKEMKQSFLEYAMSVIISRAIPDARDGLKPVHRRVLYAMYDLGMLHDKPYKKSARIVGEIIGKYHPHGDMAVYFSLVRMAQNFSLRYPLIDGQGNFGSIDGDNPAAMRYTEARMSKIASELVLDIDKETIDFVDNYDNTEKEPQILPAGFPNLLVNGSSGIAVGMATNIPPHNLKEIVEALIEVLKQPQITIDELIDKDIIKGPDFPTAGLVIGKENIKKAYLTGKSTITVRSKVIEKTLSNQKKVLIIEEIPYQLTKSKITERIAELVNKKEIEGISALRDESNRQGIRIVIELKKDSNSQVILNKLYKMTSLQVSFSINLMALDFSDKYNSLEPKQMNLLDLLNAYLKHQYVVLIRKTKYELKKSQDREHICQGLIIALEDINAVIQLIKSTNTTQEAIEKLCNIFSLSVVQSQAILQMRLQRLTGLERKKLEDEVKELQVKMDFLKKVLSNKEEQTKIIVNKLEKINNLYGDERKTQIINRNDIDDEDDLALIENEQVVVILSKKGYIKRLSLEEYRTQNRGGVGVNTINLHDDDAVNQIIIANTHDDILFFSNLGKVYRLKVYEINSFSRTARGTPIVNLINITNQEIIKTLIILNNEISDKYLFFVTSKGIIKRTSIDEFDSIRRTGKLSIKLNENDNLISVMLTNGNNEIIMATSKGKTIRFLEKEVKPLQRSAKGIKGMKVEKEDYVIGGVSDNQGSNVLTISEKGMGKISSINSYRLTKRGNKGVKGMNLNSKTGKLVDIKVIKGNEEILIVTDNGIMLRLELKKIKISKRISVGVRLIRLKLEQRIQKIAII